MDDIVPPASFVPLTASDAELTAFNFALRPTSSSALADWNSDMAQYKGADSPLWCTMPSAGIGYMDRTESSGQDGLAPSLAAMPLTHQGLTGFVGYRNTAGGYQRTGGHYKEVNVSGPGKMSTWFGLNAYGGYGELLQAGTGHPDGNSTPFAFWEIFCSPNDGYCNDAQDQNPLAIGTDIAVAVSYYPGNPSGFFQVTSNGTLVIDAEASLHPNVNTGAEADYYTEKTSGVTFMNFNTINWSGVKTYTSYNSGSPTFFGDQAFTGVEMTTDGGFYAPPCKNDSRIVAFPGSNTESTFVTTRC